jgi:hypothetical protein
MRRSLPWLILTFCFASVLFLLIYPLTIIQPFLHQSTEPLQRALFVFRIAPPVSLLLAAIAALAVVLAWRNLRLGSRIGAGALVVLTCAAAVVVRVNVFELMFHPAGTPRFLTLKEAKVDPDDMLIVVALHGDPRAYPIREMAYHHVINDVAGGVPIVATY